MQTAQPKPTDLEALKTLEAKATAGPWEPLFSVIDNHMLGIVRDNQSVVLCSKDDVQFACALRNAFPSLCRELEDGREKVKSLRASITELAASKNTAVNKWVCRLTEAETELATLRQKLGDSEGSLRESFESWYAKNAGDISELCTVPRDVVRVIYEAGKAALQSPAQTEERED